MIKAVYDTNVIVSGLIAHTGKPYQALEAWRRGDVILLVSKPILDEVVDVLQRPYFRDRRHITRADIEGVKRALEADAVMVSPEIRLEVVSNDPDDNRIFECALAGDADCVVSGDHYLLGVKQYQGIPVVTAREFLAILEEQEGAGR